MTCRAVLAAAVSAVALVGAAPAAASRGGLWELQAPPAQPVTVVNAAAVSARALARLERATIAESRLLRAHWGTPIVRFARAGGWTVTLEPSLGPGAPAGTVGWHWWQDGRVQAQMVAAPWDGCSGACAWAMPFSHEVLEALVDPHGGRREVCDRVENIALTVDGLPMSDFILPRGGDAAGYLAVTR